MLRFENVPSEEMPEVVRIASEMYESDQEKERDPTQEIDEHQSVVDAVEEIGVPRGYLERAAQELHNRRIERVKRTRRTRIGLLAIAAAAIALWGGWRLTHVPPPQPTTIEISNTSMALEANPGTKAGVTYENAAGTRAAVVKVTKFALSQNGAYMANLNTASGPRNLAGYRTVSFRVRGSGLPVVRLYLEAGPTERWRSQAVPVPGGFQERRLSLNEFDHQTRSNSAEQWRRVGYSAPGQIDRFSFKLGTFVNDADAHGEVAISDLRVE